jgi:basic amino acid/polyamine antiporter, APA family
MVLTASRVYFAMARDGVFFKRMGEINPCWNTPAFAILTSSIWAAALAATGTFDELMTDVVFTAFAFYALGAASIFYYRRNEPDAVRRFLTPGYPWTPLLFIGAGAAIVANTVLETPRRAFVGTALVVSGACLWFWQTRKMSAQRRGDPS